MKISEQWLREWVTTRLNTQQLAERLTLAGMEVSGVQPVAAKLEKVVVGKILLISPHPQAERLHVCQVQVGKKKPLQIVCGADNVAVGLTVPVALQGAMLSNGVTIAPAAIRGADSFGMLCSATELGLDEEQPGLMVLDTRIRPGTLLTKALQLDDRQIEIELTPNRGDCLSVQGLARELAAITAARFTPPKNKSCITKSKRKLKVTLAAKTACARYAGRVIEDINPDGITPTWMRERLRRSGLRSIHPVVDITNYVMLELGQPMHAFDSDRLKGDIRVRMARAGEALNLLDGQTLKLGSADLVIADARGPLALAGILGGQDSAVSRSTQTVFLESAWFRADAIGVRARHHGLHSESSHRFERGVDPALQKTALERATVLVLDICGGRAGPVTEAVSRLHLPKQIPIRLRASRILRVLGISMPPATVELLLKRLGMKVVKAASRGDCIWSVTPPSWRSDVESEVDLIEELARVHGYEKIVPRPPLSHQTLHAQPEARISENRLRNFLVDRDYQEAITYSFIDPKLNSLISPTAREVRLVNPIALDMAVMRSSLWPGLITAVLHNQNRQQSRIRMFEIGRQFRYENDFQTAEDKVLAGIVFGSAHAEQWSIKSRPVDFYDVKGDIDALLELGGPRKISFHACQNPALHPGLSAEIRLPDGKTIGKLGVLHPDIQKLTGLNYSVILFEIELNAVQAAIVPKFLEISRYPAVRRDLSIVLQEKVSAQAILDSVGAVAGKLLVNLELFDEYRGEGIDSGRKSLSLGLTFQDTSRTLNDEDVETVVGRIMATLKASFDVQLRQ